MADTITIQTSSSTDVVKIIERGPQGPAGEGGGGDVESVNGQTGVVVLDASDVGAAETSHASQHEVGGSDVLELDSQQVLVDSVFLSTSVPNLAGIYLRNGVDNGKALYENAEYRSYFWWDSDLSKWFLANSSDVNLFESSQDTQFPWQSLPWTPISPQAGTVDVDQAQLFDVSDQSIGNPSLLRTAKSGNATSTELVLGSDTRLTNSRTPTAHASTHHTGGSDALTAANISAAPAVTVIELTPSPGSTTITTSQLPARGIAFIEGGGSFTVNLPTPDKRESGLTFSIKVEHEGASGDVFITVVHNASDLLTSYELDEDESSLDFLWDGYRWTYSSANWLYSYPSRRLVIPPLSGTLGLSEPTDSTFRIVGSSDATKKVAFEVDGLSAATTRTLTVPNASGTLALLETLPAGGTKTYAVFTATDNQPTATAFATLDTRNSIAVLDYDDAATESAVFVGILHEAASLGSGLIVSLRWMATTATSGDVRWSVAWEKSNTDLDSDSFDTATAATATANGTSGIVTVTNITCTTIDSLAAGDLFRLRVQRIGGDGADTMTGDAELVAVEIRSAA
jgi:hypothetical protein